MQEPKRGRVFHKGVKALTSKYMPPKLSGFNGIGRGLNYDAHYFGPMPDGRHHIFTDAKPSNCVIPPTKGPIIAIGFCFRYTVKSLLEPTVSNRERFVS